MRQGQQNRRGRGRSSNNNSGGNRKPQNPLSRTYESNGPDVKIRGTAAQIAEKYSTLGRDASSSGDVVMSENYLQHAEHYHRIILAAQSQNVQNSPSNNSEAHQGMNGSQQRPHRDNSNANMRDQPQPQINVQPGFEPQPVIQDAPQQVAEKPEPASEKKPPAEKSADEQPAVDASDSKASAEDQPKPQRRRRRYPSSANGNGNGNGASRSEAKDGASSASKSITAAASTEKQSSDEATTA